jgi:type II secretory pathway component PulF
MKKVIDFLHAEISAGSHLWKALEKAGIFPERIISLVRIGEESGRLIENLKTISAQQEKEWIFRSRVRSAMLYPIFVFSFVVIVGVVNAWFVLPRLATVFSTIDVKLPLLTRIVIAVGNFLGQYGFFVVPLFFLIIGALIYFFFSFPRTKYIGQILLWGFPGIKKLIQQVELSRMGYILGTLVKAGVPLTNCIHSMYDATTYYNYQKFYLHLEEKIKEGNSFQKSFKSYPGINGLIPISVQQMIFASEKSGTLAKTLIVLGKRYETKTETFAKDLSSIIEPILLVILGITVAIIALSVIMPIYSLVGSYN